MKRISLNKVMAKLAEQPEKVELGLVDDLRKYPKGYNKYSNEGDALVKKAAKMTSELKELKKALDKWAEVGNSISADIVRDLGRFEKTAKEMGFNPEIQIDYSNAFDAMSDYKKSVANYEEAARNINL
jgi:hypothetical protein